MKTHDIESLVQAAQSGDSSAFDRIYTELFTPVYRYCYIRTNDRQAAEDISQTVFIKAFESLSNYRASGRPLLAWLFTIARNSLTDMYRKRESSHIDFVDDATLTNIADTMTGDKVISAESDPIFSYAMQTLEPELYEIIQLKYVDGWHYRQIAEAVGKSESAIRQEVSRALRTLRERITSEDMTNHTKKEI